MFNSSAEFADHVAELTGDPVHLAGMNDAGQAAAMQYDVTTHGKLWAFGVVVFDPETASTEFFQCTVPHKVATDLNVSTQTLFTAALHVIGVKTCTAPRAIRRAVKVRQVQPDLAAA